MKMNEIVKKASVPVATISTVICTACSSVSYTDVEQGLHDIILAIISFASSALGIVMVWVLANLKGWLDNAKKKKEEESSKEKK